MSNRFPPLDPEVMTPDQRAVYDDIVGGVRGSIGGPFNAWLRSPVMANLAQSLGEYCRYNTVLGENHEWSSYLARPGVQSMWEFQASANIVYLFNCSCMEVQWHSAAQAGAVRAVEHHNSRCW